MHEAVARETHQVATSASGYSSDILSSAIARLPGVIPITCLKARGGPSDRRPTKLGFLDSPIAQFPFLTKKIEGGGKRMFDPP